MTMVERYPSQNKRVRLGVAFLAQRAFLLLLFMSSLNLWAQCLNSSDCDGDGLVNTLDLDDDNDGILDEIESCGTIGVATGQTITIEIQLDGYAGETSWTLQDASSNTVLSASYSSSDSDQLLSSSLADADGDYTFTITDSWGDGICCDYGDGYYEIKLDGVTVIGGLGNGGFGSSATESITANGSGGAFVCLSGDPSGDDDNDGTLNFEDPDFCTLNANGVCDILDADGDGIINQYDTDTDGDGCSDVLEGEANYDENDIDSNNRLIFSVDTDGVPGGGIQGQGQSNNASASFVCDDNDSDGILDITDFDDDNDGILDELESCGSIGTAPGQTITVEIQLDDYASETSWTLEDASSTTVLSGSYTYFENGQLITTDLTDAVGDYTFTITDSWGDGICCSYGDGYYAIRVDGVIVAGGSGNGGFGSSSTESITTVESGAAFDCLNGDPSGDEDNDGIVNYRDADFCTLNANGVCDLLDIDGDGVINQHDSDTDGDSCPDALEGGGDYATSDLDVYNQLDLSIDAQGIAGGTAQNLGESQDAGSSTNCMDSDGDGVMDSADLDDDNDGILDEDEGCPNCSTGIFFNSDFESPGTVSPNTYSLINESQVEGWETTASDNMIEVWGNGFQGVSSQSGVAFVELNATQSSTLFQEVCTAPGTEFSWSVWHRGRSGTDVANVLIGPDPNTLTAQAIMSTSNSAWANYTGSYIVPEGQFSVVFAFQSVSTATGNNSIGNFIDNVTISVVNAGSCPDTDGDGLADNVDTDSDGDGCADAIEGGGSFEYSNLDGNDQLTGAVDINGVPVIATSTGQTPGEAHNASVVDCCDVLAADCDFDGDGIINSLDLDDDNDGIVDGLESNGSLDSDNDGYPNSLDIDSDGDGIPDLLEAQTTAEYNAPSGIDTDGDGLDDSFDPDCTPCGSVYGRSLVPIDTDLAIDGLTDYLDYDSDEDGTYDYAEAWDVDFDGTPDTSPQGVDSDRDGLDDAYDVDAGTTNAGGPTNGRANPADYPDSDGTGEANWRDSGTSLPIELLHFDANEVGDAVLLTWSTGSEINNDFFTIERTQNGLEWEVLGTVLGAGHSSVVLNYEYVDRNPYSDISFYRLKQTDYDGAFEYADPVPVEFNGEVSVDVFPNPSDGDLFFRVSECDEPEFSIINMAGSKMPIDGIFGLEVYKLDISSLAYGEYIVLCQCGETLHTQRILKK